MRYSNTFVVSTVILGALLAYSGAPAQDNKPDPTIRQSVQKLSAQRKDALRDLVAQLEQRFLAARSVTFEAIHSLHVAKEQLLQAEIDLAETRADVLQLLQTSVKNAKTFESTMTARNESSEAILQARADRMKAEIALLVHVNGE